MKFYFKLLVHLCLLSICRMWGDNLLIYGNGYVVNRSIQQSSLIDMTYISLFTLFWKKKFFFFFIRSIVQSSSCRNKRSDVIANKCNYTLFIYIYAGVYEAKYHFYRKQERCYKQGNENGINELIILSFIMFPRTCIIVKSLLLKTGTLNLEFRSIQRL